MPAPRRTALVTALLGLAAACGGGGSGTYGCGIAAVAGQGLLLEEFTRPGRTLGALPRELPEILPVRLALGPAWRSVLGRTDSGLVVGVEGSLPEGDTPGYGVLVVDGTGAAQGVLLYGGSPIQGAPVLGAVHLGNTTVPLIGLGADLTRFQDPGCPIFPDSLRR